MGCFEAPSCSLKKRSDKNWHDLRSRVEKFMDELDTNPIPVLAETAITYITGEDLREQIFGSLYRPNTLFAPIAHVIDQTMQGNAKLIEDLISPQLASMHAACPGPNGTLPTLLPVTADALHAIACGDGEDSTNLTLPEWSAYIAGLRAQSRYVGSAWSEIRFPCSSWRFRPKYRFTGPFETPEPDARVVDGRPAAPLLFLSSSLDPVTPLRNARAMARRHPGSVVVEQDSLGHCAVASSPSECTSRILKAYFANGTVPEGGALCRAECQPYGQCEFKAKGLGMDGFLGPVFGPPRMQENLARAMKVAKMLEHIEGAS
jgi:pimeloyl-ACP methyl ester carboxylesterase